MKKRPLTLRQKKFVKAYCAYGNATLACKKAGFSARSADKYAHQLLGKTRVKEAVAREQEKTLTAADATKDRILQELIHIGLAKLEDVAKYTDDGSMALLSMKDMTEEGKAALQQIETIDSFDKDGNKLNTKVKFKMHDKKAALVQLSKYLGLDGPNGEENPNKNNIAVKYRIGDTPHESEE